jgi:16S rRNA (guanine527-N7)-methyltransferase
MISVFLMEMDNKNLLIEGARIFGVHLDEKVFNAFDLYLRELLKWNQKINLTAIRSEKGIVLKHFLDSLSAHPYLPKICTLLDIGSGAGFPGIPLKIVQNSLGVTSIDSTRKKVDFQRHIIRMLGLKRIEAVHGRVQDKEILQSIGGQFDIVISRAFSDLRTLLMLSIPFLKTGGKVLAMKGDVSSEAIPHLHEIEGTPYCLQKTVPFVLPFSDFKRTILLFEKG